MADPVEVIARALYDIKWRTVPAAERSPFEIERHRSYWMMNARAALDALEAEGMVVAEVNLQRELDKAREILADFVRETDEWNARIMAILGRPPNYCWQTLERARAMANLPRDEGPDCGHEGSRV
jgi:hypothetical protein